MSSKGLKGGLISQCLQRRLEARAGGGGGAAQPLPARAGLQRLQQRVLGALQPHRLVALVEALAVGAAPAAAVGRLAPQELFGLNPEGVELDFCSGAVFVVVCTFGLFNSIVFPFSINDFPQACSELFIITLF
eukprot:CAMPEP_0206392726 /NCGR_PEP_ID=MMETSP0294-20121207/20169_1 /ASSEMBLY_ACC=CAM_ASM_000327 /TAXON_ID=39354 /ORGANISM="Heterosigma akashiwo, Strain CCMP2393" /LENGTH=132 /DNA_ID=CAMNT_0053845937 /DNA_START=409 /DNA_END=806 /DNA_ORIENTATION=+